MIQYVLTLTAQSRRIYNIIQYLIERMESAVTFYYIWHINFREICSSQPNNVRNKMGGSIFYAIPLTG